MEARTYSSPEERRMCLEAIAKRLWDTTSHPARVADLLRLPYEQHWKAALFEVGLVRCVDCAWWVWDQQADDSGVCYMCRFERGLT